MNFQRVIPIFVLALLWGATAGFGASNQAVGKASSETSPPPQTVPVAVTPEVKYEFTPVVDGAEVVHDFPVKNIGEGPLAIHQVKTG